MSIRDSRHRPAVYAMAILISAILILASCAADAHIGASDWDGTLTVAVRDATPKTITYDGPGAEDGADITHYRVDVIMSGSDTPDATTGFVPAKDGENAFTLSYLVTTEYIVRVGGYIRTGESGTDADYHLIAEGETVFDARGSVIPESVSVAVGLIDEPAGEISISVMVPADFVDPETLTVTDGILSCSLSPADGSGASAEDSADISGALVSAADGGYSYALSIDGGLTPGIYYLLMSFDGGDGFVYRTMDAVRLLPGLPSSGTVSLDIPLPFESGFSITDAIGSVIDISVSEPPAAEGSSITVSLERALGASERIIWFVDGVYQEASESGSSYTLTDLEGGRRSITGVVWDESKAAAIGSVAFMVDVKADIAIEPAG